MSGIPVPSISLANQEGSLIPHLDLLQKYFSCLKLVVAHWTFFAALWMFSRISQVTHAHTRTMALWTLYVALLPFFKCFHL